MSNNNIILNVYKCELCEFTNSDRNLVVQHLNTTHQQPVARTFYQDAYSISVCETPNPAPIELTENDSSSNNDVHDMGHEMDENYSTWNESTTKLLISIYKNKKPLVEDGKIKSLKKMWQQMEEEMRKEGYNFSPQQLENKWKSLERSYKTTMENRKKTGRGRKHCPYERELGDILTKRHSIEPVCVIRSLSHNADNQTVIENADDLSRCSTPTTSAASNNTPTTSKCKTNSMLQELQELRHVISERNRARDAAEQKKLQQREEMIQQLKRKNELLEKLVDVLKK